MGPRDPRHQFQGEERDAAVGRLAAGSGLGERIAHADHDLPGPQPVAVGMPGVAIGTAGADGEQAVGGKGFVTGDDLGAGGPVGIVGKAGRLAGAALNSHVDAGLLKRSDGRRHEGHTPFAGKLLLCDGNLHRVGLLEEWGAASGGRRRSRPHGAKRWTEHTSPSVIAGRRTDNSARTGP